MLVRAADGDDVEAIAVVHVRSWQVAYRGQIPEAYLDSLSVDQRVAAWREILRGSELPRAGALVLEEEGKVVGFAHIAPSRDDDASQTTGEVTAIYLEPGVWRRRGGRLLLHAATETLRSAGFDEATLWVLQSNDRARRFYEAMGWSLDGASKTESGAGFELVEIRYRIAL